MSNHTSMAAADRLAAQDVIVRYANCIDERDFETYRTCFAPDVVFTGFTPDPVNGIDEWVVFVEKQISAFTHTQHLLGPPSAVADGEDLRLRTDLQASHFFREPEGRIFTLWGVYLTRLVRDGDGEWRMTEHHLDIRATRFDPPAARS